MSIGVSVDDSNWLTALAGLPSVDSIEPLDGGWDNSNSLLTLSDGTRLVLKIWNAQSEKGVRTVIERQLYLQQHGIPTSVPIQLADDERYALRGGVAWTLMPFVDGGMLSTDSSALESLGESMATMHDIPLADCFSRDYRMGWSLFERMYKDSGPEPQWPEFIARLRNESVELKGQIPNNLPEGILHGDLFPDNVIGGNSVAAIIDFEEAWIGPCVFDLVMAFVGCGWQDGVPVLERWDALLTGYQSVRPLTESEKRALPVIYRYATLSIAAWRYWKHVMSDPVEEFADRYLEMLNRLDFPFDFPEGVQ